MGSIPIYKAEVADGLGDVIRTSASVAYLVSTTKPATPSDPIIEHAKRLSASAALLGQVDLFYLDALLTSIGWNLNDDVFDKIEVWLARATPEDKPFNLEHNPRKVIGHIVGNYAVDDDGKRISDGVAIDELPDKFHIITNAVIYKFVKSKDEELEKEMAEIISEIAQGSWYVSMEALFTNFDYAVKNVTDGSVKVISRTDESSFLTKHLKAYGGTGIYQNHRIGRLLRNITFSGKGLVRTPANPESVILNTLQPFSAAVASRVYETFSKDSVQEKITMADDTRLSSLEASLLAANERNKQLEKQLVDLGQQQVQAQISGLNNDIKGRDETIASLKAQVETEQQARKAAETKVKELDGSLATANESLDKIRVEQVKTKRVSAWVDKTGASLEDATKHVDSFAALDDTHFTKVLELQPAKAAAVITPPVTPVKKKDDVVIELNKVVPEPTQAAVTTVQDNNGVEATRASVQKLLSQRFLKKPEANDEE